MKYDQLTESLLSRSSTDSDDENEKELSHRRPNRFVNKLPTIFSAATLVLVLVLLVLAITRAESHCSPAEHRPTIETRYGKNESYMTLAHEEDHLWEWLLNPHIGVIFLPNMLEEAKKHTEIEKPEEVLAGISMYHQLHCLASFRKALQDQRAGIDIGMNDEDDPHWPHCFNYLFQTFLCFADDTIERVNQDFGGVISGEDTVRTCRDKSSVLERYKKDGLLFHLDEFPDEEV